MLHELQLESVAASPSTRLGALAGLVLAHPGRHPAVDQDLGARRGSRSPSRTRWPGSAPGSPAASARPGRRPPRAPLAQPLDGLVERVGSCASISSPRHRGEERHRLGRRLERRLLAQALQRRGQLQERVVAERRAPRRARRCRGPEQEPARRPSRRRRACRSAARRTRSDGAAALVEHVVAAHLVGVLAAQPLGAGRGAHLLVGGRDDQELPAGGRQPSRPSAAAAATSAATWSFMSWAPRPRTSPSTMSPAHGSKLHSEGSAGTVSAWPSRHRVGPGAVAAQPGDQVRPAGLRGQELALEPGLGQGLGQQLLGGLLVAGWVDGVDPDQPLQERRRPGCRLARGGRSWRASPPPGAGYSSWRVPTSRIVAHETLSRLAPACILCDPRREERRLFDTGEEEPRPAHRRSAGGGAPPVRMRPRSLEELVGQEHLLAEGSALRAAVETGEPHSAIFYGPPGSGKTTLARIIADRVPRGLRGGLRGQRGAGRGPGGDRACRGAPPRHGRADDLLPRRDPPLQQGPAGRAAARGRGGAA